MYVPACTSNSVGLYICMYLHVPITTTKATLLNHFFLIIIALGNGLVMKPLLTWTIGNGAHQSSRDKSKNQDNSFENACTIPILFFGPQYITDSYRIITVPNDFIDVLMIILSAPRPTGYFYCVPRPDKPQPCTNSISFPCHNNAYGTHSKSRQPNGDISKTFAWWPGLNLGQCLIGNGWYLLYKYIA